jgi:putative endonuclease
MGRVQEWPKEPGSTFLDVPTAAITSGLLARREIRIAQHNDGTFPCYTAARRPVELIFSQWFDRITDAIENERKLKGWSRAKKEALIRGDFASLQQLAKRKSPHPSRRPPATGSSG